MASEEAKRRTLSVQTARRATPPWLQELRQIEKSSDNELSRQVEDASIKILIKNW